VLMGGQEAFKGRQKKSGRGPGVKEFEGKGESSLRKKK